ncbi:hypothetical protein DVH24_039414 [Malus domestica]|uniref:At2g35280-like TPR domain-containing protein n=1 Tax=Malus domestica TaxID=3750 RepID=A0A498I1A9_MALDO|nr:hypothetical protein DVH24_039414 [Malus domestica]
MVCKKFNQIDKDDHIFEHINIREIEGFNLLNVSKFLKRCTNCGNSNALYMLGMTYFFQDNKEDARIEAMKMAISKGHEVNIDVYAIILVCYTRIRSIIPQVSLNRHKSGLFSIMECREMVQRVLSQFDCIEISLTLKSLVIVVLANGIRNSV